MKLNLLLLLVLASASHIGARTIVDNGDGTASLDVKTHYTNELIKQMQAGLPNLEKQIAKVSKETQDLVHGILAGTALQSLITADKAPFIQEELIVNFAKTHHVSDAIVAKIEATIREATEKFLEELRAREAKAKK